MKNCTICNHHVEFNYCSKCGQQITNRRINFRNFFTDLLDSFFALEKSIVSNLSVAIKDPAKLVNNYWKGNRNFYFSPGKFLVIATLLFSLNFMVTENSFFGLTLKGTGININFAILILFLTFSSISSYLVFYFVKRKNLFEHVVMNIYNMSLWSIVLVPISVLCYYMEESSSETLNSLTEFVSSILMFLYLPFIISWNTRVFQLRLWRSIYLGLACIVVFLLLVFALLFLSDWLALEPK